MFAEFIATAKIYGVDQDLGCLKTFGSLRSDTDSSFIPWPFSGSCFLFNELDVVAITGACLEFKTNESKFSKF